MRKKIYQEIKELGGLEAFVNHRLYKKAIRAALGIGNVRINTGMVQVEVTTNSIILHSLTVYCGINASGWPITQILCLEIMHGENGDGLQFRRFQPTDKWESCIYYPRDLLVHEWCAVSSDDIIHSVYERICLERGSVLYITFRDIRTSWTVEEGLLVLFIAGIRVDGVTENVLVTFGQAQEIQSVNTGVVEYGDRDMEA
ncbi:hypothetical protein KC640_03390 [Candidatus Dojkabacteria bacterium]|uniref:Uncharacterized protein n=1 Tax=Candidatus Dojkabacteria bacterium TaxID=2099670 RepID=A0A955IA10_9BACT|nr:hypothetical protein [Candidatus Dojkabacteria bacterium]